MNLHNTHCSVGWCLQYAPALQYCENANTDQSEAKDNQVEGEEEENKEFERDMKLHNSDVLRNIHLKLSHLETEKQKEITKMIQEFEQLFNNSPGLTHLGYHDVEAEGSSPIKQHPYRVNPKKKEIIEKEIKYGVTELSQPQCLRQSLTSSLDVALALDNNVWSWGNWPEQWAA